MIHGPVRKDGAAVNEPAGNRTENARIVGADAMIPHDEVIVLGHAQRPEIAQVLVLRRNIWLRHNLPVDVHGALSNFNSLSRQSDNAFDERFRMIQRIPEHHHITALNGLESVDKLVNENAFLVGEDRKSTRLNSSHRCISYAV